MSCKIQRAQTTDRVNRLSIGLRSLQFNDKKCPVLIPFPLPRSKTGRNRPPASVSLDIIYRIEAALSEVPVYTLS
jgi:hypothetical protein